MSDSTSDAPVPASSELIFGENATDAVALDAHGVKVYGAMRAGGPTCRLDARVTITLHGARPATRAALDALPQWHKGIFVSGSGVLELFGRRFHRSWTRLESMCFYTLSLLRGDAHPALYSVYPDEKHGEDPDTPKSNEVHYVRPDKKSKETDTTEFKLKNIVEHELIHLGDRGV